MLKTLRAALRGWFREAEIHREVEDEREFHIAMRTAELVQNGMAAVAAADQARKQFGPALRMHEEGMDIRGGGAHADVAKDARMAIRLLRKTPSKTIALITTLALAIGINSAVFTIVKAVLLDPLPFAASDRLVVIHQVSKGESEGVSYPNFEDWRAASRGFDGMAVYASTSAILKVNSEPHRVFGAVVSADLFHLLRVSPLRGRLFSKVEDEPGADKPVVISDRLGSSQFGELEEAVGKTLALDGIHYRVIGVIPSASAFPVSSDPIEYWTTVAEDATPSVWGGSIRTSRGYPRYEAALARLKPDVTIAQAQAEMIRVATLVAKQHPSGDGKDGVRVGSAIDDVIGGVRPLLWTLYAAVFCVLAVGCANTASLLLVGAIARRAEFALRAALGAQSSRLVRQLLVESLVVALAGGAAGVAVAWGLKNGFVSLAPPEMPRLNTIHADVSLVLYAAVISALTGIIFGIAPAGISLRQNLVGTLKEGRGTLAPGPGRFYLRRLRPGTILITVQIALSLMLGCCATVLAGSFWRILHTPRGFDPHNIRAASISLPAKGYPEGSEKVAAFYESLIDELRRTPGFTAASATQSLPLSGQNNSTEVSVIGADNERKTPANLRFVDPGYFGTLRVPLLDGRAFNSGDRQERTAVVIVNHAFVSRFLPGQHPLGAKLRLGWGGDAPKVVVGVVGDILHDALDVHASPEMYVPMAQFPLNNMEIVIRASGDTGSIARMVREKVKQKDSSVPVEAVRTLDEYLQLSAAPQRFLMWVLGVFAIGTLLLASIGLYGALNYSTVCRRHEFGVRIALGSSHWGVMSLVLREGGGIALAGMAFGLALTVVATRFISSWLYATSPLDRSSLVCASVVLAAVAGTACCLAARRATHASLLQSLSGE